MSSRSLSLSFSLLFHLVDRDGLIILLFFSISKGLQVESHGLYFYFLLKSSVTVKQSSTTVTEEDFESKRKCDRVSWTMRKWK